MVQKRNDEGNTNVASTREKISPEAFTKKDFLDKTPLKFEEKVLPGFERLCSGLLYPPEQSPCQWGILL